MDIRPVLPESAQFDPAGCAAAGGSYTRVDRLREFVNGAISEEPAEKVAECDASPQPTANGSGGGGGGGEGSLNYSSPLGRAIGEWNDRYVRRNTGTRGRHVLPTLSLHHFAPLAGSST